jgi:integrase
VELPRQQRAETAAMEVGEVRAFLEAVAGTRYEAVFVLMVGTGMRPSEILALRWEDVDLEAGTLRVRRTLPKDWPRRLKAGRDPFEEPKTQAGARAVDLAAPVIAALRSQRARQGEQRLLGGTRYRDPYGLVFTTGTGRPLGWDNLRARHFKPALQRAGIPEGRFRAYDLRHAYATHALGAGASPMELQERMGHSDVRVTLGTYVHTLEEQRRETTDRIAAQVFGE